MLILCRQKKPCLQGHRRDPNIILRDERFFLSQLRRNPSVDKGSLVVWKQNIDGIQEQSDLLKVSLSPQRPIGPRIKFC